MNRRPEKKLTKEKFSRISRVGLAKLEADPGAALEQYVEDGLVIGLVDLLVAVNR